MLSVRLKPDFLGTPVLMAKALGDVDELVGMSGIGDDVDGVVKKFVVGFKKGIQDEAKGVNWCYGRVESFFRFFVGQIVGV
jgi:hypothetical protein